jgi:polar amino acid transport system permease protein
MLEILQVHGMQLLLGYYPHGPLGGLALTLLLALSGLVLALPTALLIVLGLFAPWHCVRMAARLFVFYVRSVPLVVHLLWAYFLVPLVLGRGTPLWAMLMVVLVLFNGAYLSQAIAAAIRALPAGQFDAARSLGLRHYEALRLLILPQALRNAVPSIVNQLVLLIKETALGSVIGMHEISMEFMRLNDALPGRAAELFTLLGLTYFLLCYPLTLLGRRLERRPAA